MTQRFSKDFWPLRAHPPRHDVPAPMHGESRHDEFLSPTAGEETGSGLSSELENRDVSGLGEEGTFVEMTSALTEDESADYPAEEIDPEAPRLFSIDDIERCSPEQPPCEEQTAGQKFVSENRHSFLPVAEAGESFLPNRVYLPESYEPNYAYPLVIWLHDEGSSEHDLARVMPQISTRNYLGVSFRAPRTLAGVRHGRPSFGWSQDEVEVREFAQRMKAAVLRLRSACHIHSERIFLAGQGGGATMALRLLLEYPEWFGGAAMFGGELPAMPHPLARFPALASKRLLISGVQGSPSHLQEMIRRGRLLHAAGMQISTRPFRGGADLSPQMLSLLNQWVMEGVCQPART